MGGSPSTTATSITVLSSSPPSVTYSPCSWSVSVPSAGRPARVIANNEQLVFLRALYARAGGDVTREDIDQVSKETGLQERWIRKWIQRQGATAKRKKKKPRVTLATSTRDVDVLRTSRCSTPSLSVDMDFKPAGDFGIDCASGSASIASGGGSGPSTIYSSSATMSPVSEVSALMNPDAMFDFNGGISHTPVTSPPVQFAQPGTSFTVPLRVKTSTSSPLSSFASPTAAAEDSSHLALSAAASLSVSPGLGMASSNLELLSTSPALPSFKTHFANLTSSTHILNRVTLSTQDFNTTSAFAPSEACPIESAMPLPACLAPSATYLYHLFTETGEASGTLAPPILPPDLWVSPPGAPTYVAPGLHPAIPLPTPVSYQMQLSHLVALTKSMREAKLETEPVATGSGSNGGQKLEEHERTPQDLSGPDIEVKSDPGSPRTPISLTSNPDDEEEVITPCEEPRHFLESGPEGPKDALGMSFVDGKGKRKEVVFADVAFMDEMDGEAFFQG